VSIGRRRAARVALLLLPAAICRTVAAAPAGEDSAGEASAPGADTSAAPPIDRVEVTLVGDSPPCPRLLRDVVAGQLADLTPDLVWVCRERVDPEAAFRSDSTGAAAIRIAIELRAGTEARLTLGDTRSDRFVVRRVPLQNGLDELGREQIGQIVRFATLALRAGSSQTLSRTEARAAVASWAAPRVRETSPPPRLGQAPPRWAVDLGPIWSVSIFSREIPVVQELAAGAAVGGIASHVWGWVEAGYRFPARDEGQPIGVELRAASLRFGVAAGQVRTRSLSFSGGAGIGLDRVRFAPIGASASVQPAAPNAFWNAGARLMLGGDWRATTRLTIGARLACDIAAADVHYDLRGADGSARRVVTAFRVAPGLGVTIAWRL
jgi:hypothetical protein